MEKVDQNPVNVIAPLIKVLRGGLLTLPAATRRKLGLRDGDYLQAVETEEGVLLKPVTVVDRKEAWASVMAMVRKDKWKGPGPRPTPEEEEQWIFDVLAEEENDNRHA